MTKKEGICTNPSTSYGSCGEKEGCKQHCNDCKYYSLNIEEELLEKANRDYGIGVVFKSTFSDCGLVRTVKPYYPGATKMVYEVYKNYIRCKGGMGHTENKGCSNPIIYENGVWAEIVSTPKPKEEALKVKETMFKKDDYIVFTEGDTTGASCFPLNYVFKQRLDEIYLCPYLDTEGSRGNGWDYPRRFDWTTTKEKYPDESCKNTWRYATKEEIEEYDRLGRPFNINTLKKAKEEAELYLNNTFIDTRGDYKWKGTNLEQYVTTVSNVPYNSKNKKIQIYTEPQPVIKSEEDIILKIRKINKIKI
jgi:hypothetical protein